MHKPPNGWDLCFFCFVLLFSMVLPWFWLGLLVSLIFLVCSMVWALSQHNMSACTIVATGKLHEFLSRHFVLKCETSATAFYKHTLFLASSCQKLSARMLFSSWQVSVTSCLVQAFLWNPFIRAPQSKIPNFWLFPGDEHRFNHFALNLDCDVQLLVAVFLFLKNYQFRLDETMVYVRCKSTLLIRDPNCFVTALHILACTHNITGTRGCHSVCIYTLIYEGTC